MIEHPITTRLANEEATRLEPSTAAIRALNDAMALVCEQLLAPRPRQVPRQAPSDCGAQD